MTPTRRGALVPEDAADLLRLLRDGRPRTRAQLAVETGLARSTVAGRLDALMASDLVVAARMPSQRVAAHPDRCGSTRGRAS